MARARCCAPAWCRALRAGEGSPTRRQPAPIVLVRAWRGDPVRAPGRGRRARRGGSDGRRRRGAPARRRAGAPRRARLDGDLLLVLDQFEEYFLYHGRDGDRLRHELLPALARADLRARVLVSLREDTLASLDLLEGSSSPPFGNLVRLGPMPEAAAVEAITRPLAGGEMAIEPELPDHVLALLQGREPGAGAGRGVRPGGSEGVEPAYLQLVMRRLWERERESGSAELRIETLRAMGSLRDIVSEHLGEAMGALTPAERGGWRTRSTTWSRRPARRSRSADPTSPASRARGRTSSPPRSRSWPAATPGSCARSTTRRATRSSTTSSRSRCSTGRRASTRRGSSAGPPPSAWRRRPPRPSCSMLAAYIIAPAWLDKAELRTLDTRFAIRGDVAVEPDIVIVDLDDASLAALGGGGGRIPRRRPRAHDRHPAGGRCER